ncbi:hypothetical protein CRE_28704 [Caenorhabditis remanei]|uniref:Uncharacterized protein n=1 Tax=Caenorhabditis remanei TaxID=31234 RepID=E3MK37_CAERE|nr:hypothetical protein CRE_28704 [Caenorhabditis remanei]
MTSFVDNQSLTNYLIIDYDSETDFEDDDDYEVFMVNNISGVSTEKPRKVRKCMKRGFVCCFKTIKYTFLCCRCVIVWRCLWLFVILLIGMLVFVCFYYDDVRKVVQFIYIVIDTSIHLYKRLDDQN